MQHPRPDLLALFEEADASVDAMAWHVLLTGGKIEAGMVRTLRTQTRLDLLDQLAVQRNLDAISDRDDQLPRRPRRKVKPISEPPY